MIRTQKITSNVQNVPRQSPDFYWHAELCSRTPCSVQHGPHSECVMWWPSSNHELCGDFCAVIVRWTEKFDHPVGLKYPHLLLNLPRPLLLKHTVLNLMSLMWQLCSWRVGRRLFNNSRHFEKCWRLYLQRQTQLYYAPWRWIWIKYDPS